MNGSTYGVARSSNLALTAYIQAAMRHARYEWLPHDSAYYAEIPELPGVWASGGTLEAAREERQEVLEDWIVLGLDKHLPIPTIDGLEVAVSGPA